MGYVHDTHMSRFIAPAQIQKTAGTWTPTLNANTWGDVRTAAGASFTLLIPIPLPSNDSALKGSLLKSIDVFWKNATADLTAFTVALNKQTLPANAAALSGAEVTTVTLDTGNDTAAERYTQADHSMKITLDTPAWIDDGESYFVALAITAAANSVFTLWGARANFTERK
jgi:hypothetical protein